MGTFTEAVTMECTPEGVPLRMWWRGLRHEIIATPRSWYQRRPWWQEEARLLPGEGEGYVDTQIWRLQLAPEGGAGIVTMDVVLYRPSLRWRVIKVHPRVELDAADSALDAVELEAVDPADPADLGGMECDDGA